MGAFLLPNQEILVIHVAISRIGLRLSGKIGAEEEDGWLFETSDLQPEREIGRRWIFFIFFGRNPLISPDSEKKMKRNESNFAFISLH